MFSSFKLATLHCLNKSESEANLSLFRKGAKRNTDFKVITTDYDLRTKGRNVRGGTTQRNGEMSMLESLVFRIKD